MTGGSDRRLATWIYSSNTVWKEMTAEFTLAAIPATDYRLLLSAQDGDSFIPCRIEILVNGHSIFSGENPFSKFAWSRHEFRIPSTNMNAGQNVIVIRNTEPGGILMSPPWFMLNYALIKKEPPSQPKPGSSTATP